VVEKEIATKIEVWGKRDHNCSMALNRDPTEAFFEDKPTVALQG
jgi:hypothetical protein